MQQALRDVVKTCSIECVLHTTCSLLQKAIRDTVKDLLGPLSGGSNAIPMVKETYFLRKRDLFPTRKDLLGPLGRRRCPRRRFSALSRRRLVRSGRRRRRERGLVSWRQRLRRRELVVL